MAMGVPPKQGLQGHRPAPMPAAAHDGDETVPLINGGLAAKAMKGCQSIAQLQSQLRVKVGSACGS